MILMASSNAWDTSASSFCYNILVPRVSLERLVPMPRVSLILLQGVAGPRAQGLPGEAGPCAQGLPGEAGPRAQGLPNPIAGRGWSPCPGSPWERLVPVPRVSPCNSTLPLKTCVLLLPRRRWCIKSKCLPNLSRTFG